MSGGMDHSSRPAPGGHAAVHPIRVLHVITGLGIGGAETMLVNLAVHGRELGLDQRVVSLLPGGENARRLRQAGVPVDDLAMAPGRPSPAGILRLARLMRRHRPQVVQSWMYHADLAAWAARAMLPRGRRPKLAWGIRCSDMQIEHYGRQLRWVIGAAARLSGRPDAIVANSEAGAEIHRTLGYRNDRLTVIANGIDTDLYRPDPAHRAAGRRALGLADDAVAVVMVARSDAMKDHGTFLAAMARAPELSGVLVGLGTETLSLPPNVTALGARHDLPQLLPGFDVIALSSAFGEGFSNALAEAMAAGLVPVATDVGDARLVIGDAGFIVTPRDPAAFADALRAAADAARRKAGTAARERIVTRFSLPRALAAFRDLYAALAGVTPAAADQPGIRPARISA
jgi:glycosyltransferase involved in cell wall biosynthesis